MIEVIDFVTVVVLGLTVSFAPCMFPILPSFVAFIARSGNSDSNGTVYTEQNIQIPKQLIASLLVTLGIMTVFIIMGILINTVLFDFFNNNYREFRFYQGVLLVVLGLFLSLQISVGTLQFSNLSGKISTKLQNLNNPWLTSYFIGLFFALLGAPCGIVAFGTVFLIVSTKTTLEIIILMVVFSIGAGIPFFVISGILPSFQTTLKKDAWTIRNLSRIAGIIVIITGSYLIIDAFHLSFTI